MKTKLTNIKYFQIKMKIFYKIYFLLASQFEDE
jgi:hypothetical protein|uniref:Uncharacterized protein n=1 Tax=viral metagenome TaxID=1070528 RepID=A0A6C0IMQ4_9ZZZZ